MLISGDYKEENNIIKIKRGGFTPPLLCLRPGWYPLQGSHPRTGSGEETPEPDQPAPANSAGLFLANLTTASLTRLL